MTARQVQVSFDVEPEERALIRKIVDRANRMKLIPRGFGKLGLDMDLCATIAQGNPLRLDELLAADNFNFAHDVCGIMRHMNRETGELTNCFEPRFTDYAKLREIRDQAEHRKWVRDVVAEHRTKKAGNARKRA